MENNWDFGVSLKEVQVVTPLEQKVKNLRATVDDESGRMLGLVGGKYILVQNKDVDKVVTPVMDSLGLDLKGVSVLHGRKGTIFNYNFRDTMTVEGSAQEDDKVNFGFEVVNSFDRKLGGSRFVAFARRLVCLNGQTVPKEIGRIDFRALGGLSNTDDIHARLAARAEGLVGVARTWSNWAKITPPRHKVEGFIQQNFRGRVAKGLIASYETNKNKSAWDVYNLLSFHVSHDMKISPTTDPIVKRWTADKILNRFYAADFVTGN